MNAQNVEDGISWYGWLKAGVKGLFQWQHNWFLDKQTVLKLQYGILKLLWIWTLMLNMWIWGFNFWLSWDRSGLWETLDCPGPWQQPGSTIILGSGQQDWYLMIIRSSYAALPHPTTAQTQRSRNPWKRSRHDCCQDGGGTRARGAGPC